MNLRNPNLRPTYSFMWSSCYGRTTLQTSQNFCPIWLPHWPAWRWTISLMLSGREGGGAMTDRIWVTSQPPLSLPADRPGLAGLAWGGLWSCSWTSSELPVDPPRLFTHSLASSEYLDILGMLRWIFYSETRFFCNHWFLSSINTFCILVFYISSAGQVSSFYGSNPHSVWTG